MGCYAFLLVFDIGVGVEVEIEQNKRSNWLIDMMNVREKA